MIEEAFLHFKGIGKKKKERLEQEGIYSWSDFNELNIKKFFGNNSDEFSKMLDSNRKALLNDDIEFFVNSFHIQDKWKILHDYFDRLSYFDIETDGYNNKITVIVCLHKGKLYKFVRDENLNEFLDLLDDVELMVSFNGGSFDLPVVLKNFYIPEFPVPHIDLRWITYHEGLKGGLKKIEKDIGIYRPGELESVDGLEAVYLWFRWLDFKDELSLKKLINYCSLDVISLKLITEKILLKKSSKFKPVKLFENWEKLIV